MPDADTHKDQIEEARALFKMLHWPYWLTAQGAELHGSAGLPDMFVVARIDGKETPFFWECKVGRDKLSAHQVAFQVTVERHIPVLVGRVGVIAEFFGLDRRACDKEG